MIQTIVDERDVQNIVMTPGVEIIPDLVKQAVETTAAGIEVAVGDVLTDAESVIAGKVGEVDVALTASEAARLNAITATDAADATRVATDAARVAAQGVVDSAPQLLAARDEAEASAAIAAQAEGMVENLGQSLLQWNGTDDLVPLHTDNGLNVTFGFRQSTGKYELSLASASVRPALGDTYGNQLTTTESTAIYPLVVDATLGIALGVDRRTGTLVGPLAPTGGVSAATRSYKMIEATYRPMTADILGMLGDGQSLVVGAKSTPVLSTVQPFLNIGFGGGPKASKPGNVHGATNTVPGTTTTKPLVEDLANADNDAGSGGDRGETICSGAANYVSRLAAEQNGIAPATMQIFASVAGHGGYTIAQLSKGAPWYQQHVDHAGEQAARSADLGKSYVLAAVPWLQGESDGPTTAEAYTIALNQRIADTNTDCLAAINAVPNKVRAQTTPIHYLLYQLARDTGPAEATIRVVNGNPLAHFVSPIHHLAFNADGTHLTAISELRLGYAFGRAYKQLVVDGREPDCIWPIAATATGQTLTIRMRTPTALALDTVALAATTDMGFVVKDDTGALALTSITTGAWYPGIDGRGYCDVTIALARPLQANPRARYARDYLAAGRVITVGRTGNLRDTTADKFTLAGTTYPLWHVAPSFDLPVSILPEV